MSEPLARPGYKDFTARAPDVYAGLAALTKAVDASGLEKGLTELVKLRASQINGCAFCLKFHLGLARKAGVAQDKLDLLATWWEAGLFTAREKAALAYAETLTALDAEAASDEAWAALRAEFSEDEALFLTVAVATINAWNRIGIALRFAP
ncbi:carboxymuconolactone decarboxylase family protein [Xanthobacter dioxanivorans]|uniref:Carboxymuconolactone decarboxylase family protein n=1 Tax=Xanthobacter dioxanivorans TaxID=2528964 RepID=A0A974SHK9_9HYPH|nr:carboxymuconolactone decarboxylase family protein [Xanthobacter dioxanivorans]QRG06401.1 carboxymuconolactone decarboxylase family protein [Xanthobacter dioxanivorans]